MKITTTTYGMWEAFRKILVKDLIQRFRYDQGQVDSALLGPVISTLIEKSFTYQRTLPVPKDETDLKNVMIQTYRAGLNTVLKSLVDAVGISLIEDEDSEFFKNCVAKFVQSSLSFSDQNIDFLVKLATISKKTKEAGIQNLYGKDFTKEYPSLVKGLYLNDPELLKLATDAVSLEIEKICSPELLSAMKQHEIYMKEIASQMINVQFEDEFVKVTGKTMKQYKEEHHSLSNQSAVQVLGRFGQFSSETTLSVELNALNLSEVTIKPTV